jgi:uncharacterized iron-regulated membrane protein
LPGEGEFSAHEIALHRIRVDMKFKKSILALHRWAGLITGSVFLIVSLSGAVYVFEKEIFAFIHRDLIRVEPAGSPMLPATQLLASGQALLGPRTRVGWIEVKGPDAAVEVTAYEREDSAGGIWYWDQMKIWKTAYVNPYTGEAQGLVDRRFEFFQMTRQVHQNLLLRYDYGHWIVAVTVLVFLFMMVTGLFLWLPRNRAALKHRLKVAWGAGRRRLQFDLHVVSGVYIWIPVLIVAVTGLTWSFEWWSGGVNFLLSGNSASVWEESPEVKSGKPALSGGFDSLHLAPLDMAFREAARRTKAGGSFYVSLPQEPDGVLEAAYQDPAETGWNAWSEMKFDRHTGALLHSHLFEDQDIRKRFAHSVYDIHVGSIYGWPTQILAFLVCLLSASLPITGFLMWRSKRRKTPVPREALEKTLVQEKF